MSGENWGASFFGDDKNTEIINISKLNMTKKMFYFCLWSSLLIGIFLGMIIQNRTNNKLDQNTIPAIINKHDHVIPKDINHADTIVCKDHVGTAFISMQHDGLFIYCNDGYSVSEYSWY